MAAKHKLSLKTAHF